MTNARVPDRALAHLYQQAQSLIGRVGLVDGDSERTAIAVREAVSR